ncbi:hypothetical protein WCX72_07755 [Sulfurimonas sp. HSL1-6]|uniref:hypothetical protein n=1 Tax=Thiomicrolovo immobilis TaxID=3131935 RepID=UPI0031F882AC
MLSTFNALKSVYASREISMEDLDVLQQYDFIQFENRGISRSEKDCLLCEVRCEPFAAFLTAITAAVFDSAEALRDLVRSTGLGLLEEKSEDAALLSFYSEDKMVEIIASVADDGRVSIDPEDLEVLPFFQVFLRVQH